MGEKKILIASVSFYPRITPRSYRATELAKEFARQGHDVTVVTKADDYDYSTFCKKFNFKVIDFVNKKWGFNKFGRRKTIIYYLQKIFQKATSYFFMWPDIKLTFLLKNKLLNIEEQYDLLISIAIPYPIHWGVAYALKKKSGLTKLWVADCGDPFMMNHVTKLKPPFYFKYLEKWYSKKADFISITLESFKVNYYKEFHHKIVEIPQGFKFDELNRGEYVKNKIPTFAFAGKLIKEKRDPCIFLDYLSTLNLNFKFIFYLRDDILIKPYYQILKNKIEIKEYIPREQLLEELSRMDFLVNFEYDPLIQSPSKLIDYSLTMRPILNISSLNFNTRIVDEFLEGKYENQFILPNIHKYRIENVTKQFLSLSKR